MTKSPQAFRSIGEVARLVGVATHVLRYWESQFPALSPVKRPDGRRYYRPDDVALAAGLCEVMREDGLTIRGANLLIAKDKGAALRARGRLRLGLSDGMGEAEAGATAPAARPARSRKATRQTLGEAEAGVKDAADAKPPSPARAQRRAAPAASDTLPLFADLFAPEADSDAASATDAKAHPAAPSSGTAAASETAKAATQATPSADPPPANTRRADARPIDATPADPARIDPPAADTPAAQATHRPPPAPAGPRSILWLSRLTTTAAALRDRTTPLPDEARHLAHALRQGHHA